jgi:hypothetical protein
MWPREAALVPTRPPDRGCVRPSHLQARPTMHPGQCRHTENAPGLGRAHLSHLQSRADAHVQPHSHFRPPLSLPRLCGEKIEGKVRMKMNGERCTDRGRKARDKGVGRSVVKLKREGKHGCDDPSISNGASRWCFHVPGEAPVLK